MSVLMALAGRQAKLRREGGYSFLNIDSAE